MAGGSPVLTGILAYLGVAVAPTLIFWVSVRWLPAAIGAVVERRKVNRSRSRAANPPIEKAVANLHRLRREVCDRQQPNQVRQVALLAAYDETLIEVCQCVGVDPPLATAIGQDRPFARLLTEAVVEDAGIVLDPPGSGAAAA